MNALSRRPPHVALGQSHLRGSASDLPSYAVATDGREAHISTVPTTRLAGVDAILNLVSAGDGTHGRRRKAAELDSLFPPSQSLPPLAIPGQSAHSTPMPSPRPPYGQSVGQPVRRILTARSPSLHRAPSIGQLQPLTGPTIMQQASQSGSPRSRVHALEPGTSGAPPLPPAPDHARTPYDYTSATPSAEAARRAGMTVGRSNRAASGSASPSSSYSSYSQNDQTSPAGQFPGYNDGSTNSSADRQRHMGIPISSSGGQNTYQMMTLETTSGTVQLPVDVQAASRVADEKRRRNAGASARFRQRRKEKEKEASVTIGRLEQQVKELGEDADFYRRERDHLSAALFQMPSADRYFPRPLSPRRRRTSIVMAGSSGRISADYMSESGPRSPQQSRNVRRRRSTLSVAQTPAQTGPQQPSTLFQAPYPPPIVYTTQPPTQQQIPPGRQDLAPLPSPMSREQSALPMVLPPMLTGPQTASPLALHAPPQSGGPWNPYATGRRESGAPRE
ncbi:hypothetical protein LTR62_005469 [Meristemomyces frigidus]|uniref:BZIP domain-containing protein n=1 Tax=Meristemomyces frigidus TaxID=1508187 RepID=A0AAN7TDI8_9PEZI|nr:hypothetical protein LTR62_005469 [Meristemomyces frigidus]